MMAAELDFPIRLTELGHRTENVVGLVEPREPAIEAIKSRAVEHVVFVVPGPHQVGSPDEIVPSTSPSPGVRELEVCPRENRGTGGAQAEPAGPVDLEIDLIRGRVHFHSEIGNGLRKIHSAVAN